MGTILYFTGSGVSKPSGIPTFRGSGGLYENERLFRYVTIDCRREESCRREAFSRYIYRSALISKAKPNAYHKLPIEARSIGFETFVVTQNVDDLHERLYDRVFHIHGEIRLWIGRERLYAREIPVRYLDNPIGSLVKRYARLSQEELLEMLYDPEPLEGDLYKFYRPGVVLYGEPVEIISIDADIAIIAGTSAQVYPAAMIPYLSRPKYTIVVSEEPIYRDLEPIYVRYRGREPEDVVEEVLEIIKDLKSEL